MKKANHIYPTWYWLWNIRLRRLLQVLGIVSLLLVFYGLLQDKWQLNLFLLPALVLLVLLGNDRNFKRGNVPSMLVKRMLKHYSGQLNKHEAFYIVKRVYEKSGSIAPQKPKDLWLTRFYFGLSFTELAKSEQDSPEAYNELRDYIFSRYY